MLRSIGSTVARHGRTASHRSFPGVAAVNFHASAPRSKEEETAPAPAKSSWEPIYGLPVGIAVAIPAIHYEWLLINEETQLAACFIAFTAIIYKQFGGVIQEALEDDGKRVLSEHNAAEDMIISSLNTSIENIKSQDTIVEDIAAVKAIKVETYKKLNEVGKIKPLYDFKAQIEKLVGLIGTEETVMREKAKSVLMAEATVAVKEAFVSNAELKKASLSAAIATLKGGGGGAKDPVQQAYLKYFAEKKKSAEKINPATEAKEARDAIILKLNSVAMNDGFYFKFDESGKPQMIA